MRELCQSDNKPKDGVLWSLLKKQKSADNRTDGTHTLSPGLALLSYCGLPLLIMRRPARNIPADFGAKSSLGHT